MKPIEEEIRYRFPRITMSLIIAFIILIIGFIIPPTVSGIIIPGLNMEAGHFVWIVTMITTAIFLIRALADSLVIADIVIDIIVKRLGIREEKPPKRAARELIYIIVIILITTAVSPIITTLGIGQLLAKVVTYAALALIVMLIYDIGRIFYKIIEEKADLLAERLSQLAEKDKGK
jgi:hypothetical protein